VLVTLVALLLCLLAVDAGHVAGPTNPQFVDSLKTGIASLEGGKTYQNCKVKPLTTEREQKGEFLCSHDLGNGALSSSPTRLARCSRCTGLCRRGPFKSRFKWTSSCSSRAAGSL
jgi:hypothetical protein